jgi:hypothetical protein
MYQYLTSLKKRKKKNRSVKPVCRLRRENTFGIGMAWCWPKHDNEYGIAIHIIIWQLHLGFEITK